MEAKTRDDESSRDDRKMGIGIFIFAAIALLATFASLSSGKGFWFVYLAIALLSGVFGWWWMKKHPRPPRERG